MLLGIQTISRAAISEPAASWLQRMTQARATLAYDGKMVYLQDGRMSTLGIIHRIGPNGSEERLHTLDGEPREVVRNIDHLSCKLSAGNALEIPLSPGVGDTEPMARRISALGDHYRVTLQGHERIADRDTQRIDLMPKGRFRYGHRLWLDSATGLPLKTQLVGSQGKVMEQVMFTEIQYQQPTTADLGPPAQPAKLGDEGDRAVATGTIPPSSWRVDHPPEGFRLTSYRLLHHGAKTTEHLVYTDGMSTVSVFIEDPDPAIRFNGVGRRGTVSLYGRTYAGHQITVIGEVPETTVRRIGDGLRSIPRQQTTADD
jgi:sigma-E factor negative regulatory protein RseB